MARPPKEIRWLVDPESGCWVWQLYCDSRGYGRVRIGERPGQSAHRWSYEHFVGRIPEGLQIDHTCQNRSCVNPDHLEPVTHLENNRRASERQRYCKHGHEFTPENTRLRARKGRTGSDRICIACLRRRNRQTQQNRKIA